MLGLCCKSDKFNFPVIITVQIKPLCNYEVIEVKYFEEGLNMTTYANDECKCAVCGTTKEYYGWCSATTFSGPDLDLRPAEMMRGTMREWVQSCPECGYVSSDVSNPTSVTREWLKSEKYRRCDGISFNSGLARKFYKYYLINLEDQKRKSAFFAVLHAAWACDDAEDEENAKRCREIAIPLATSLIEEEIEDEEERDNIKLIKADLMRRADQFDELITTYSSVHFDDELLTQIIEFQIEKAKERDTACYRVEDVTGDE